MLFLGKYFSCSLAKILKRKMYDKTDLHKSFCRDDIQHQHLGDSGWFFGDKIAGVTVYRGCWQSRHNTRNNCSQFEGNNWRKKTRNNCSQFESRLLRKNFLMSLASIGAAQITRLHWITESKRKSHLYDLVSLQKLLNWKFWIDYFDLLGSGGRQSLVG